MNFEDIQKNWQQQTEGEAVRIKTDFLLKEVRRNKQYFDAMIFWRDLREAGLAIILAGFFLYFGIKDHIWSMYCMAGACLFVAISVIIDRNIQKRKKTHIESSLQGCIGSSLAQVNHQIRLLKNVFWWYLFPIAAGGLLIGGQMAFMHNQTLYTILKDFAGDVVTWAVLCLVVWWLNQYAVKKVLIPRKNELEALLKSIESADNGQQ